MQSYSNKEESYRATKKGRHCSKPSKMLGITHLVNNQCDVRLIFIYF